MIENLLDSLNVLLLQHPHLLQVMHTLFWIKYWLLLGIVGVFIYLAFTDDAQPLPGANHPAKAISETLFIA